MTQAGSLWIPKDADDTQLCSCIIAHTDSRGHRAARATNDALSEKFYRSTISSEVETFVHSRIHCLSTVEEGRVLRSFGPAIHINAPNDLLQFDNAEIATAASGEKYILMLCDYHSNYCLFSFPDTSAENATRAIIDKSAAFGV